MTRLAQLATAPLIWRIVLATALAFAVLTYARLPQVAKGDHLRFDLSPVAAMNRAGGPALDLPPPPLPDSAQSLPIAADAARISNAQVPIADVRPAIAAPFRFIGAPENQLRARDCLAIAAWYEAGDDPAGERAVVQVVLNRVRHPAFPDNVCAVVFQGSERTTGCQFSFTCDGSLARIPSSPAFARARAIASAALAGMVDPVVGLATHYHADYVVPRWRDGLVKIAQQGAHLFYRWPGYWGSSAAMARGAGSGNEAVESAIAALSPAHSSATNLDLAMLGLPTEPASVIVEQYTRPPLPEPAESSALEMQLDPAAPPGSYALKALALCSGAADCRVAGRLLRDLAFVYVRKRSSGEGAYWDCTRFARTDRAQCLPQGPALARLLAAS